MPVASASRPCTESGWLFRNQPVERGREVFTSWIVPCVPFAVSRDLLPDLEQHDAAPQSDCKPTATARETSNTLAELEFSDLGAECVIPEDHFVWWVEWTATATEQKEERRGVHRHDRSKGASGEL